MIRVFTDGACLYQGGDLGKNSKGPGGWGFRIELPDGTVHEEFGSDSDTTNNRMEMVAGVMALRWLSVSEYACDGCGHRWCEDYGILHMDCPKCYGKPVEHKIPDQQVTLYSDSQYLVKGITSWVVSWEKNGWKTIQGAPVQNQDLWLQLRALDKLHIVNWLWVKGHEDNPGKVRADELATMGRLSAVKLTNTLVMTVKPKVKPQADAILEQAGMKPALVLKPKPVPAAYKGVTQQDD
jgi:ribonuclease HI